MWKCLLRGACIKTVSFFFFKKNILVLAKKICPSFAFHLWTNACKITSLKENPPSLLHLPRSNLFFKFQLNSFPSNFWEASKCFSHIDFLFLQSTLVSAVHYISYFLVALLLLNSLLLYNQSIIFRRVRKVLYFFLH